MTVSYSQMEEVCCNQCGRRFDEEIWLIVDTKERQDLVEKIKEGVLHVTYCPHCGKELSMDIPLLIYNHRKRLRIIFSPQNNTSEIENQEILDSLLELLSENLEGKFKSEWIEEVETLPKIILPHLLPDKKNKAAGTSNEVKGNKNLLTETEARLFEMFLGAETLEEKFYILDTHPEFISDRTIKTFEQFIEFSLKEEDHNSVEILKKDLELFRRCKSVGIGQAFDEAIDDRSSSHEDIRSPHELKENEDENQIAESEMLLLERFPEAETVEEKHQFLKRHPDFLSDKIIKRFEEYVEFSIKEGDHFAVDMFGKDLILLKKCQSLGIDQAFEDLNDPYALYEEAQQLADQYLETPNNVSLLSRQMEIYSHLFNLYAQDDLPASLNPATILANFGINATERYGYTERVEDLNGAITALEVAIEFTKDTDPSYGDLLKRLGHAYGLRYNHLKNQEDLGLSKEYYKRAKKILHL